MTNSFTRWSLLAALLVTAAVALTTAPAGAFAPPSYEVKTNLDGRQTPGNKVRDKENFLKAGWKVRIVCQEKGQWLYGSNIWDLVKRDGIERFVPDAFISTGYINRFVPGMDDCDAKDLKRATKGKKKNANDKASDKPKRKPRLCIPTDAPQCWNRDRPIGDRPTGGR